MGENKPMNDRPQTATPGAEVAEQAVEAAKKIAADINGKVIAAFRRLSGPPDGRFFAEVEAIFSSADATVGQALFDSQVAAYLEAGGQIASPLIEPATAAGGLPPIAPPPAKSLIYPTGGARPSIEFPIIDKAGELLQQANILQPEDFYSLSAAARGDAFTISGGLTEDSLQKVHEILHDNINSITSREAFMNAVEEQVGGLPISEAHLEQVFRNNTNAAYSDGGEAMLAEPTVSDAFPFRAYYAIRDSRVRPTHRSLETAGLSGTNIFHKDDPVWQLFRPPWDWNCRCGWTPMTIRQAARNGVAEAVEWLETGIEPANLRVAMPDFRPSESWQRIAV
jgi:SPP1 gp7 family putative phage head morphogenesis protein